MQKGCSSEVFGAEFIVKSAGREKSFSRDLIHQLETRSFV